MKIFKMITQPTELEKQIIIAFGYSYQYYDHQEKLKIVIEALEKAKQKEYLSHTIKQILIEVGFYDKNKITKKGLDYLNQFKVPEDLSKSITSETVKKLGIKKIK